MPKHIIDGEEFDLRVEVLRAAGKVLTDSPESRMPVDRAERLAEQVLLVAARKVMELRGSVG